MCQTTRSVFNSASRPSCTPLAGLTRERTHPASGSQGRIGGGGGRGEAGRLHARRPTQRHAHQTPLPVCVCVRALQPPSALQRRCVRAVCRTPGRGWAPLIARPACAPAPAAAHAGAPAGRDHRCRSARVTLEVGVAVGTRTTCALARSFLSQQLASVWSAARAARPARARGVQRRAGPRSVVRTHCNAQRCTGALHNAARPCSRQAHMASPLPWRAPWRPAAAGRRPGSAAVARGRDPGRAAAVWEALAVAQGGGRPSARSTHKHQQQWWRCAASSSLALHTDTRCQERRGGLVGKAVSSLVGGALGGGGGVRQGRGTGRVGSRGADMGYCCGVLHASFFCCWFKT